MVAWGRRKQELRRRRRKRTTVTPIPSRGKRTTFYRHLEAARTAMAAATPREPIRQAKEKPDEERVAKKRRRIITLLICFGLLLQLVALALTMLVVLTDFLAVRPGMIISICAAAMGFGCLIAAMTTEGLYQKPLRFAVLLCLFGSVTAGLATGFAWEWWVGVATTVVLWSLGALGALASLD